MKNLIHSFVFAAIAVFMSAMSAKAQSGPFTEDDLKLMVATVNMQLGVPDMLKTEHFAPLKGGDASNKFAQANGLKTASISGRYTFVPRGSKINKAGNPKDTTMTVLLADANKLMGRAYAGTNMVFLYGYDKIKQTFLFITKYEDTGAVVAQAQQAPTIPTPQPSAQPVPVQQLTPAQQAFMDQVAYAMKGGAILDRSVAQDGHGHMTVKDSLGRITTFDVTAGTVLYSSNPSLAPATGVSGPAVGQPYGATAQQPMMVPSQNAYVALTNFGSGAVPNDPNAIGFWSQRYTYADGTVVEYTRGSKTNGEWQAKKPEAEPKWEKVHMGRNDALVITSNDSIYVHDPRSTTFRKIDGRYDLETNAPTAATETRDSNRGIVSWVPVGMTWGVNGWNNGYNGFQASPGGNNCYPNGGGGNGSQVVAYTGFQVGGQ